jgi:3-phenylpropionate/cinnamic acid dioxygenase small subunit
MSIEASAAGSARASVPTLTSRGANYRSVCRVDAVGEIADPGAVDDRGHIENLIARYTHLLDGGDWDAFGELFAEGDWVLPSTDFGQDLVLRGPEVTAWMHATIHRYADGTPMTNHVTTNLHIEIAADGRTAETSSYLTVFQAVPPGFPLQAIFCGRYLDRFAKTDRTWRFARRKIVAVSLGDMRAHVIGP